MEKKGVKMDSFLGPRRAIMKRHAGMMNVLDSNAIVEDWPVDKIAEEAQKAANAAKEISLFFEIEEEYRSAAKKVIDLYSELSTKEFIVVPKTDVDVRGVSVSRNRNRLVLSIGHNQLTLHVAETQQVFEVMMSGCIRDDRVLFNHLCSSNGDTFFPCGETAVIFNEKLFFEQIKPFLVEEEGSCFKTFKCVPLSEVLVLKMK